jgi:UDP-2,4-diacetamido-2,4,6-trideoxy-beta-L-altropyranose hydrolase
MRAWTIANAPSAELIEQLSYLRHAKRNGIERRLSRRGRHVSRSVAGDRIAFRCDGNERIGAGHVARCLPLAAAFAHLGWRVSFVGTYEGLAGWLLARAKIQARDASPDSSCGIYAECYDAVIIDSYAIAPESICDLARRLPLATIAEANRCPTCGVLLDYHLDRVEPSNSRLLAGPSYAPLDPALAGSGRPAKQIGKVLVTVGGSLAARELLGPIASMSSSVFADAHILLAGGAKSETTDANMPRVIQLPSPSALLDVLPDIDLAITTAGLSAYELACAGIPQLAIAIADNQRRVLEGLNNSGLAPVLDLTGGDSLAQLPAALELLRDPGLRRRLAVHGRKMFDGQGARRAAIALTELYLAASAEERYPKARPDS